MEHEIERDISIVKVRVIDPEQELLREIEQEEDIAEQKKNARKVSLKKQGAEGILCLHAQETQRDAQLIARITQNSDIRAWNVFFGKPVYTDLISGLGCAGDSSIIIDSNLNVSADFIDSIHRVGIQPKVIPLRNTQQCYDVIMREQPTIVFVEDEYIQFRIISQCKIHCAVLDNITFKDCHIMAFVYSPTQDITIQPPEITTSTPSADIPSDEAVQSTSAEMCVSSMPELCVPHRFLATRESTKVHVPNDKKARKAFFRAQQKQDAHLMNYARSLLGGNWELTNTVHAPATETTIKETGKGKGKGKSKGPGKAAEKIRLENIQRLQQQKVKNELEKLKNCLGMRETELKKITSLKRYSEHTDIRECQMQANVYILELYFQLWSSAYHNNKDPLDPKNGLMYAIQTVLYAHKVLPVSPDLHKICMLSLGFTTVTTATKTENMDIITPRIIVKKVPVGMSFERFQLEYMGGYMSRGTDLKPDPRVPFCPEPWQKSLLDIVDKSESVLVVAPTSAGKTFVSYYAMKKILQDSDTDVIVYVAPTKSLVNQVIAEVFSRFPSKNYTDASRRVFGAYLPDFNTNPFNCQILVTIPVVLEALLLSPDHIDYCKTIKYIILDEIHCINSLSGGVYWERIIELSKAPIIALSATIENPEYLREKIAQSGIVTHCIVSPHRYSYLYHYEYIPEHAVDVTEITSLHINKEVCDTAAAAPVTPALRRMHPLAGVSVDDLKNKGLENCAPDNVLRIYTAISRLATADKYAAELKPEVFFKGRVGLIDYPAVRVYLAALMKFLMERTDNAVSSSNTCLNPVKSLTQKVLDDLSGNTAKRETQQSDSLFAFAVTLNHHDLLPSIMFAFDRNDCNDAFTEMLESLKKFELAKKVSSTKEKHHSKQLKQEKRLIKKTESSRMNNDPQDDLLTPEIESIDNQFSFVKTGSSHPDIDILLRPLVYVDGVTDIMIEGLRRGIGIHHDGVHNKYRQVVETLFRMKHLRIVFATETLAIGINMPCRTVVFLKDSTFLNTTFYRQMSGRSGRRGFDLIGHVIFYDIPRTKQRRLIMSSLPKLTGGYDMTAMYALRTILKDGTSANIHHTEYLRDNAFITHDNKLLGIAGIANSVYQHESGNIALAILFRDGTFNRLCADFDPQRPDNTVIPVLTTLANLFSTVFWPRTAVSVLPKDVILQPLSDSVQRLIGSDKRVINAYLVNFWERQTDAFNALTIENLIPAGSVWGLLKQFVDILVCITKELESRKTHINSSLNKEARTDTLLTAVTHQAKSVTQKTTAAGIDSESDPDSIPDNWDSAYESDSDTEIITDTEPTPVSKANSTPPSDTPFSQAESPPPGVFTKEDQKTLMTFQFLSKAYADKLKSFNFAGKSVFITKKK